MLSDACGMLVLLSEASAHDGRMRKVDAVSDVAGYEVANAEAFIHDTVGESTHFRPRSLGHHEIEIPRLSQPDRNDLTLPRPDRSAGCFDDAPMSFKQPLHLYFPPLPCFRWRIKGQYSTEAIPKLNPSWLAMALR